jgi:hypothetical protein
MPRAKSTAAKNTAKLSLYIPPSKGGAEVLAKLRKLAQAKDRSVNYLVVEAILQYLKREEKKAG